MAEVKPTRGQEDTIGWPRGTFNLFCIKSCYDLLNRAAERDLRKMGSEANFVSASIPKFDSDYDHWSMVMENLLRSKEYWVVIESGYSQLTSMDGMTPTQKQNL
ncbi:hypothetical protein KIW84_065919 [Lathyrus oleraceus]|uniref:Uncharacterized protein n=1 Tax=Pisum sativum TaxID=3888 RepID=A0A9D4WG10_PEA|nr:hypothetical protein KIW84_065919 [Pisum sativum]